MMSTCLNACLKLNLDVSSRASQIKELRFPRRARIENVQQNVNRGAGASFSAWSKQHFSNSAYRQLTSGSKYDVGRVFMVKLTSNIYGNTIPPKPQLRSFRDSLSTANVLRKCGTSPQFNSGKSCSVRFIKLTKKRIQPRNDSTRSSSSPCRYEEEKLRLPLEGAPQAEPRNETTLNQTFFNIVRA